MGLGNDDPLRQDVEEWLLEKEIAVEQTDWRRHRQLLFWGRIAGVAAVAAVVIGIIGIALTYLAWKHPVH